MLDKSRMADEPLSDRHLNLCAFKLIELTAVLDNPEKCSRTMTESITEKILTTSFTLSQESLSILFLL